MRGLTVEINANPHRLDLQRRWHRRAVELGCVLSINPDAHSIDELDLTHWGVLMARKGAVPAERVLNALEPDAVARWFEGRRKPGSSQSRRRSLPPRRRG
jgi:DNA polymerase (family 10)